MRRAWASSTRSTSELLIPDPAAQLQAGLRRAWSGRGRSWAAGGGTSTTAWPTRSSALRDLPPGTLLETPWSELRSAAAARSGCGAPATSTSPSPGAAAARRSSTAASSRASSPSCCRSTAPARAGRSSAQLEKYMSTVRCPTCDGQRLNPQARAVTVTTAQPQFRSQARPLAARSLPAARSPTPPSSSASCSSTRHGTLIASEVAQGDPRPAGLPAERRARLPHARSHRPDALRRRDRSGFAWPARSAAGWSACCTSSTSRRSACIRATTTGCWTRSAACATWATRWSWSSTTKTRCGPADHIVDFGPGPGVRGGHVVASGPVRT